jgi:hypothetical protein
MVTDARREEVAPGFGLAWPTWPVAGELAGPVPGDPLAAVAPPAGRVADEQAESTSAAAMPALAPNTAMARRPGAVARPATSPGRPVASRRFQPAQRRMPINLASPSPAGPLGGKIRPVGAGDLARHGAAMSSCCDYVHVPHDMLTWPEVSSRLAVVRNYWLGTTMPSGAPHAAPVWGVVTSQRLYLYSERSTVKAGNIAADPRVLVHLESGDDVVIVRGVAEDLGAPSRLPSMLAALAAKYTRPEDQQYLPGADPDFDVVYAIRPKSAMMWRLADYEASQRRWSS